MKGAKRGFTLVEIMVVVGVIGLIAAIAIPNYMKSVARARAAVCAANIRQMENAAALAQMDGVYVLPPYNDDPNYVGPNYVWTRNPNAFDCLVPAYLRNVPHCPAGDTYCYLQISSTPKVVCPKHEQDNTIRNTLGLGNYTP